MRMGSNWLSRTGRSLGRTPVFTAITVTTLAIGIGATGAMFAVVNSVLLKPLPFEEPERLVGVWHVTPGLTVPVTYQAPSTYFIYRESGRVFEDIGLWEPVSVIVTGTGDPETVSAMFVTDGTLPVLRVTPTLGRTFTAEEDKPYGRDGVMLGHAYWQERFGGDLNVVGRALTIDGKPREIVGVLPQGFSLGTAAPALVLPFRFDRSKVLIGSFMYHGIARLKPGVTIAQANADIARMVPLIVERFPLYPGFTRQTFESWRLGPNVRPLEETVIGPAGRVLWILLGAVCVVLLIACANVASLFVVRAESRRLELATRAALGAGRRHLAAVLLSEAIAVAVAGSVLGAGFSAGGIRVLITLAPESVPRLNEIRVDPVVLSLTAGIAILTAFLCALTPILQHARPAVGSILAEGRLSMTAGRGRHRVRNGFLIAQIALAVVLLVASGLMVRTFMSLRRVAPGFTKPEEVLSLTIAVPEALVRDPKQAARVYEQVLQRIRQIPGVSAAGLSSSVTMDGSPKSNNPVFVEDFQVPEGSLPPRRRFKWIGTGYFEAMGRPIIAGRDITWADNHNTAPVVVVTENLARQYWKEPAHAIGKRLKASTTNPWREIVGVVGDERDDGAGRPAPFIVYWPMLMEDFWERPTYVARKMAYVIRSGRLDSPTFLREVQAAIWSENRNLALANVRTMDQIVSSSMAQTSFALITIGAASAISLLLALVGTYGLTAYIASQRVREVGIRMALGAQPSSVIRLFLQQGALLATIGVGLGLGGAAALASVMSAMVHGVEPVDPLTYVSVAVGLGGLVLLAGYLPARRASLLAPTTSLRTG